MAPTILPFSIVPAPESVTEIVLAPRIAKTEKQRLLVVASPRNGKIQVHVNIVKWLCYMIVSSLFNT